MKSSSKKQPSKTGNINILLPLLILVCLGAAIYLIGTKNIFSIQYENVTDASSTPFLPVLDVAAYNLKLDELAHIIPDASSTGTSSLLFSTSTASVTAPLWPVKTVYPNAGAILPFKRIVAYYGNFYSSSMGILGQYPPAQVLSMLMNEVSAWQVADPTTPVVPAIDYIAVTAQGSPGDDGKYRIRMPDSQIDQALSMANQVNGLLFLDVQ